MAMSTEEAQKVLGNMAYPCTREQLVEHAQKVGADQQIVNALRDLPDQKFEDPSDVTQALRAE